MIQETWDRRHGTEDMGQETGDMIQETWVRRQEIWDRRQEKWDRRHGSEDIGQKTWDRGLMKTAYEDDSGKMYGEEVRGGGTGKRYG